MLSNERDKTCSSTRTTSGKESSKKEHAVTLSGVESSLRELSAKSKDPYGRNCTWKSWTFRCNLPKQPAALTPSRNLQGSFDCKTASLGEAVSPLRMTRCFRTETPLGMTLDDAASRSFKIERVHLLRADVAQ